MTPPTEQAYCFPGSGRLASLLLYDWYAGIIFNETYPLPSCSVLRGLSPDIQSDHDFFIIPSQTQTEGDSPILSCICKHCRYNFVFQVDLSQTQPSPDHLEHHFVTASSTAYPGAVADENKLRPATVENTYRCSVCEADVSVVVLRPRIKIEWIKLITDKDRIRRSLEEARKNDPERYADTTAEKITHYQTTPLATLNAYLNNILIDDERSQRKRISARNKTFTVQFGTDCENVFEYLEFEKEEDDDGEVYWLPPRIGPHAGKTVLWSKRAFYEVVKSEVQSILDNNNNNSSINQPIVRPISSARELLARALGCEWPTSNTRLDPDLVRFRQLGAPISASDDLLKYAYLRQVVVDEKHKSVYLDAISYVASSRCEDLQFFAIAEREAYETEQQQQRRGEEPITAYSRFGLAADGSATPEEVLRAFWRYMNQQPHLERHGARADLLKIADHLGNNMTLRAEALSFPMNFEEAFDFFGVNEETELAFIYSVAKSNTDQNDAAYSSMAWRALSVILEAPKSQNDKAYATLSDLAETLRPRGQIPPHIPGVRGDIGSGSNPHAASTVNMALPAGIYNIGNTCYLNSILQYCYSIRFIRDFVKGCSNLSESDISGLLESKGLLGSQRERDRNPAFIGVLCARELGMLFHEMESTRESFVRPKQRLANAALIRPDAKPTQPPTADIPLPPLPPRRSEREDGVDSTNASHVPLPPDTEEMETASNASSRTLVGLNDVEEEISGVKAGDGKPGSAVDTANKNPAPVVSAPTVDREFTLEELTAQIDKEASGTEQSDVEEIMSRILGHLQAAMKLMRNSDDIDPIQHNFFSQIVEHRKKPGDNWVRDTTSMGFLHAIPAESAPRDIYDALEASFALSGNDQMVNFTTIEKPAPILRILIPRSQIRGGVEFKNEQLVRVPFELFIDRFMHVSDHESDEFKKKKKFFDISERLKETEVTLGSDMELEDLDDTFFMVQDTDLADAAEDYEVVEPPALDGEDETSLISTSELDALWKEFVQEEEAQKKQLLNGQAELVKEPLNLVQKAEYRLHAVFCHRGGAKAGHYWLWLYDSEQDVWRKYNDERVTAVREDEVEETLTKLSEPYYLSYVKVEEYEKLVSVPSRQTTAEDVEMKDVFGKDD